MNNIFLLLLRKLHGRFYEWRKFKIKQFNLYKQLKFPLGRKVYIIGTPSHTNVGDSAIVIAQRTFLATQGFMSESIKEISFEDYLENSRFYIRHINKKHLIAQLGGGNMGNQWMNEENFHRKLIVDFPNNPQIIFPQTIHFTNDENGHEETKISKAVYNAHNNLTLVARELTSFEIAKDLFRNARIIFTPDIVLSSNMNQFGVNKNPQNRVMLCFRNDCERAMCDDEFERIKIYFEENEIQYYATDMHTDEKVSADNRNEIVRKKMQEFANSKLVITDRLHGMIFAAVTGTPCIALSNYNHKVKGTYEWISYLPYIRYAHNINEAINLIPEMLKIQNPAFDNTPLLPYFEKLAEVIKEYAAN